MKPLYFDDPLVLPNGDVTKLLKPYDDIKSDLSVINDDLSNILTIDASIKFMKITKYGRMVNIFLNLESVTLESGNDIICIIPEEYRPINNSYVNIHARNIGNWSTSTYYPCTFSVLSNGNVLIRTGVNYENMKYIQGCITYISNK